jgi:Fe2+ or Zn2+ uptake regulation protein
VPGDKDKDRREAKRARARSSPVRARMLDLCEADPDRLMDLQALFEELTDEGWDVTVAQVHYHLLILIDAELVCRPKHGG